MYHKSDEELVLDSLNGDNHALAQLISKYQKTVYNVAFRLISDVDDAAEVTQQTFLNVIEKLHKYDSNYKFFSWLYRIAMNEAIDFLRKKGKQQQDSGLMELTTSGPDVYIKNLQLQTSVQAFLMKLKEDHRSIVVLKYFADCNYQEISHILRIPVKTVKSRLYTARQEMRAMLCKTGQTHHEH